MVQLNLEVRASTPQESPDIVILAGHLRFHYQLLGEDITQTLLLGGTLTESNGLELCSSLELSGALWSCRRLTCQSCGPNMARQEQVSSYYGRTDHFAFSNP